MYEKKLSDVTHGLYLPTLVTNCHFLRPLPPLERDVSLLYGRSIDTTFSITLRLGLL